MAYVSLRVSFPGQIIRSRSKEITAVLYDSTIVEWGTDIGVLRFIAYQRTRSSVHIDARFDGGSGMPVVWKATVAPAL